MSYLVDTNVLSELRRKQPQPEVVAWFTQRPRQMLYLSVLSLLTEIAILESVAIIILLLSPPHQIRNRCSSQSAGGYTARSNSVRWTGSATSRIASTISGASVDRFTILLTLLLTN